MNYGLIVAFLALFSACTHAKNAESSSGEQFYLAPSKAPPEVQTSDANSMPKKKALAPSSVETAQELKELSLSQEENSITQLEEKVLTDDRRPLSLPSDTLVLHVGDSFAGALGIPLGRIFEDNGIHSVLKNKDASYLTDLAWDGELQLAISKYQPDLVLITVGANELGIAEPEKRASTIKRILKTIGDRPCLWVGIPLWKGPQNGLMSVIEKNAGQCVYWNTSELIDVEAMPRIQDGIHPTLSARQAWAAQVFDWLRSHREPNEEQAWALKP